MSRERVVTLQVVFTDREVELLRRLADKLGVTISAILNECATRALESES